MSVRVVAAPRARWGGQMTGDAVRGVKFPRAWRGYDPGQVDRLVRNMGRFLDAECPFRPPRRGRGSSPR
jgi:DivIVA domain-containing protein